MVLILKLPKPKVYNYLFALLDILEIVMLTMNLVKLYC